MHDKPGVGITIFLASRKPAKMEAAVSPIEALGYRPSHNASKIRKAGEGNLLTRLFGEQFTKDKKRTFMVLLSLAASLSVYLCVVTSWTARLQEPLYPILWTVISQVGMEVLWKGLGSRLIVIEPHFYERDMSTLDLELS